MEQNSYCSLEHKGSNFTVKLSPTSA